MLYESDQGHHVAKVMKSICCVEVEDAVDYSSQMVLRNFTSIARISTIRWGQVDLEPYVVYS